MRRPPSPSQLTGDAEPGWTGAAARAAVVAVLLAAAVIGLRARGAVSHRSSSLLANAGGRIITSSFGVAEGAGLVAVVVVLALILRRPRRHEPEDEAHEQWRPPLPWWVKPLAVLFVLAMLVAPVVILLVGRTRKNSTLTPLAPIRPPVLSQGTGHPVASSGGSPTWPLLAGVLLAVAAVFILAILARRRRHQDRARRPGRAPGATPLAEGLAAGQDALLAGGEPRAAIIACYAAMERGFAVAGSAPAAADTPAEVLTRASAAGLVRSGSAEVLTGLFRRARYSSQPMTSADSKTAASALARMRADLGGTGPGSGR